MLDCSSAMMLWRLMPSSEPQKLSTSALAKALQLPSQQLFGVLKDYGWIKRSEDSWVLTAKGEFEGGEYVHSKRYGRYIVWPPSLSEHALLRAIESHRMLSASVLAKPFNLTAREVNRLLAELGWIKHGCQGWELTAQGEQHGGVQLENDQSGTFYVVWPEAIQSDALLQQQLQLGAAVNQPALGDDLFSSPAAFPAVDGHQHRSHEQLQICHWLYMSGLAHACRRRLPCSEELYADFYLPSLQLYIEFWGEAHGSGELNSQLQRKAFYQESSLMVIDLEPEDMQHLDDVLTREFRKRGIRIY